MFESKFCFIYIENERNNKIAFKLNCFSLDKSNFTILFFLINIANGVTK